MSTSKDSVLALVAGSLFSANQDVNKVITTFKKEINNFFVPRHPWDLIQRSCSMATNLALNEVLDSLLKDRKL